MTAFIVDRTFGGVTSGSADDKHGIRGANSKSETVVSLLTIYLIFCNDCFFTVGDICSCVMSFTHVQ